MAQVVQCLDAPSTYRDNRSEVDRETERRLLAQSSTLYVGNLSFYTTEAQIYQLFLTCAKPEIGGGIKRIIMGLDRNTKTPCGFAFVEYFLHEEATDYPGYKEGRQFGRGRSGGQVRDEFRQEYDSGRGGWGHQRLEEEKRRQEQEKMRSQMQFDTYAAVGGLGMAGADVPKGEDLHNQDRQKRGRSEDEDENERREDEKRLRGERDDE
ncbi:uncharacterized protein L203_102743 [Cryptococcus depauperatus CBS 7841]|uniref:Nuclear cap-binding protein subunit 2 n=1 Tax=Cryptococcus depauperatus CBS 7841 TaxID=1295531 RepID=A0AAJ8JSB0_9TREE